MSNLETEDKNKSNFLGSNYKNQPTSEHALHEDKTWKDSNFSQGIISFIFKDVYIIDFNSNNNEFLKFLYSEFQRSWEKA